MKNIAILFGGVSAEHEVSVITGLQVVENINQKLYSPHPILLSKNGEFKYYQGLKSKKQYLKINPTDIYFAKDNEGPYIAERGILGPRKTYIDAAYLAFHGGNGEAGQLQGFLETLNIPYTSPNVESSTVSMNKQLTKQILNSYGIKTVEGVSVCDEDIKNNVNKVANKLNLKLPVIIKPAHLGSSIAINIASTKVELKKHLLEAAHVDSEILVEKLIKNFTEYNIAVRKIDGKIETSEIERPLSTDEILSFADKYEKGGKKSGGMASLNRELPAKISKTLEKKLKSLSIEVFKAIRAKGMVRIDFMVSGRNMYVTEVNPIPGSMSYYLWEASGISFKNQITDLIEQAIADNKNKNAKKLNYNTDIVDKFINKQ